MTSESNEGKNKQLSRPIREGLLQLSRNSRWGTCIACPFRDGETEEATIAQNLGCLPSKFDMVDKLDREQVALSCHKNNKVPCRGLAAVRDVSKAEVKAYSDWYHNG